MAWRKAVRVLLIREQVVIIDRLCSVCCSEPIGCEESVALSSCVDVCGRAADAVSIVRNEAVSASMQQKVHRASFSTVDT